LCGVLFVVIVVVVVVIFVVVVAFVLVVFVILYDELLKTATIFFAIANTIVTIHLRLQLISCLQSLFFSVCQTEAHHLRRLCVRARVGLREIPRHCRQGT
jgi:hypothetical protein